LFSIELFVLKTWGRSTLVGQQEGEIMTAQKTDRVLFKGDKYSLIGMTEGKLASPEQFGMEPEMISTTCVRGFYATYELTEKVLYLRKLTLRERNKNYQSIGGIKPEFDGYDPTYYGLSEVILFTGKVRLAKDFIKELYIHMGYQKPTAFKTVFDITLNEGVVVAIKDRSEEMEQKRGDFKRKYESMAPGSPWIQEAFSLDMDLE
jgi:hypothetical protein